MTQLVRRVLLVSFLVFAASRFVLSGLLPATRSLAGDFAAVFPTSYFAQLRPDFPTEQVWAGWYYGPMLHFLTLPLLLVPTWSLVPAVWALVNCAALAISFMLVRRLPFMRSASSTTTACLAALWLLYQPLVNCISQGNIEIVEMAMMLGAIVALSTGKDRLSGVLIGVAAMTKFLPFGFLAWFLLRRFWRAFGYGLATVAVVAVVTSMTLQWKNAISLENMQWSMGTPLAGLQELSVTTLFMHRTSVLLQDADSATRHAVPAWFPAERAAVAFRVGLSVSLLLGAVLAVAIFRRRHRPDYLFEVVVMFMTMFMILPWNHDYYYLFALVPISVLLLDGVERRARGQLTAVLAAYFLISPPIPFSWIDRTGWLQSNFADLYNYLSLPILGALILWVVSAYRMFLADAGGAPGRVRGRWSGKTRTVAGMAGAAVVVAVVAWGLLVPQKNSDATVATALRLEPQIDVTGPPALALSPDGAYVAYVARLEGVRTLCLHATHDGHTRCLPATAGAAGPFFSPDSRWVAFFAERLLKKVAVDSDSVVPISESRGAHVGSWANDGTILVASPNGIMTVSRTGARMEVLVPPRLGGGSYSWPSMLPSGDTVLFAVAPATGGPGIGSITAFSIRTGRSTPLLAGTQPSFDEATGLLTYSAAGRILRVPFDPGALMTTGPSFPLVPDVLVTAEGGPHAAHNGTHTAFVQGNPSPILGRELVWVSLDGTLTPLPVAPDSFETPRISPDGRAFAVGVRSVVTDLRSYDLSTMAPTRISFGGVTNHSPVWSPVGEIAFSVPWRAGSESGPHTTLLLTPPGGTEFQATRLWYGRGLVRPASWSAGDGRIVGTLDGDLWMFDPAGVAPSSRGGAGGARTLLAQTAPREMTPAFSQDGRYFAYASNESGRFEIYVRDRLESADRIQVSADGGTEPVWSASGRELFYRHDDAVLAVPVDTRSTFSAGTARVMFRGAFFAEEGKTNYDVGPDGRFLMLRPSSPDSAGPTTLVIRRAPALPAFR